MKSSAELVDEITVQYQKFGESNDEQARKAVVAAAGKLITQLENPMEQITRIGWGEPTRTAALRTAFDLGLLQKLGEEPMSSARLAEGTVADPELVARILKHLAGYGWVDEVGKDSYKGAPFSMASNDMIIAAGLIYGFGGMIPAVHGLPGFLAKTGYKIPRDATTGPFQFGLNTDKPLFAYLQANPHLADAFSQFMKAYSASRPRWTDLYPCKENLVDGFTDKDEGGPLVVDVGGGIGHELRQFHARFPNHPGKLVLEDTPVVIAQCQKMDLPSTVIPLAHDFFTAQPPEAVGAKAYFIKQVTHDWPDDKCRTILSHVRNAMTPGYSKLLIWEHVVADVGATWQQTALDLLMMALLVAQERTESQFRELLRSAGLKVVKIWELPGADEKVIEAVRDDE